MATHRSDSSFGPAPDFGPLRPARPPPEAEPPALVAHPWFSWALMAVCGIAFVAQLLDSAGQPLSKYSLNGPAIAAGEWWRILTMQVEHNNAFHLLMNGTSLLGFGPFVEKRIGSVRLAIASLIAGFFGAAFALFFNWDRDTLGASAIIVGWLGLGLLIVEPRWRRVLVQWGIFIVLISLLPTVSWASHLGGFAGGLGCGALIRKSDGVVPPTRFDLFDRLAPVLIALGVMAVWAAIRFHLPGAGFHR